MSFCTTNRPQEPTLMVPHNGSGFIYRVHTFSTTTLSIECVRAGCSGALITAVKSFIAQVVPEAKLTTES
jgi:hypothetical protein